MIQNIMYHASDNALLQMGHLEKVTLNVANINTSGYKAQRFDQYLEPDGRLDGVTRTDTSQGELMTTNRKLDIAISGPGYLPVTQPDGRVAYTRDGSFAINSEGYLITNRGDMVGSGYQLPADYQEVRIDEDGNISATTSKGVQPVMVGKIALVRFTNAEGLEKLGNNKLAPTAQSGAAELDDRSRIVQGKLERANVNVYEQVDQILRLNAGIIANLRVIRFTDDIFRQAVNLRQ
ncbi:MAG: flagellar hook-basal body protein [Candidatus Melainabacteria bacterium]